MMTFGSFHFYRQLNSMDCGPTCVRMIAKYYGQSYSHGTISDDLLSNKVGMSMLKLSQLAERVGFRSRGVRLSLNSLLNDINLPCILHWSDNHFVILLPFSKFSTRKFIKVADPAAGIIKYTKEEFMKRWTDSTISENAEGAALLLEPTPQFYEQDSEESGISWKIVSKYLRRSRWQIIQVFMSLFIGSLFQLIFPYLTQSIVDTGINTRNLQYVTIILIAQLMLIFSKTVIDFIRSRLLLQISLVINISVLSDFWIKITRLPISYFDKHHTGDTLQRVNDNKKIQSFVTGTALSTFFSIFNFFIFGIVLMMYNGSLFLVFLTGSTFYFLWIRLFLGVRRKINYEVFNVSSKENNSTLQLVQGMQDIKLNGAEQIKRWEWEGIQNRIFKLNFKSLSYNQLQQAGAIFINQGKDVVITFLVAELVMKGQLTLGSMLAIQYIIGQLSGPIEQFIGFIQSVQDTKISLERINEIYKLKEEEDYSKSYINDLPVDKSICFKDLSFSYPGGENDSVLSNINIYIPEGKVTAIVGSSGSGKTTLLKLLLKFYDSYKGDITIGNCNFKYISPAYWRRNCGAVLQDGYIFNDSIIKNIAVGDINPDYAKVIECCKTANILGYIESLPRGFKTILGSEGVGVSQGQKQRILIARAIYKDPQYLFLDEATNSLDANNERTIVENLNDIFRGRTVIIIAHRLSTVRNADNIIVLDKGKIVEEGTHNELSTIKGKYFELVKNQLELGN